MAKLGIHAFCFTSGWEAKQADKSLPPLKELGISVVELPLLRPAEFDSKGTRQAFEKHGLGVTCSLGLPHHLDPTKDLKACTDFLDHALQVAAEAGSKILSGVTFGSIGKTSGSPRTDAEYDAMCMMLSHAASSVTFKTLAEPPCGFKRAAIAWAPASVVAVPITVAPQLASSWAIA